MTVEYYQLDAKIVLSTLGAKPTGLSSTEVKARLQKFGPNRLEKKKRITPLQIFINQFKSFLIWILIAAVALSVAIGFITKDPEDFLDAAVIFAIVIINAFLGFFQEYKAEKAMEALQKLAAPKAKVIRDGKKLLINSEELVPGDIILLETGDRVPADARIFDLFNLHIDEAALTGESIPSKKIAEKITKDVSVPDRKNLVYSGTIVTQGKCSAVVFATGMNTEFGKIAALVQAEEEEETPLQHKLAAVGRTLGVGMIVISIIVFVLGALRGQEVLHMILTAVSLAVAAVPEGLPAVVTITLAIGLTAMARANAVVRKLPAVETLGSTTVICSDKTGTLTKNEMTVREVFIGDKIINVTGSGYDPTGEFKPQKPLNVSDKKYLEFLLRSAVLCNNAELNKDTKWNIFGDPTEGALVVLAEKGGHNQKKLQNEFKRIHEVEFTSERKMMSTVHKDKTGNIFVFSKGAPENLLGRCSFAYDNGKVKRLTPQIKKAMLEETRAMAGRALRVLGFAYKEMRAGAKMSEKEIESELIFIGLAGMIDPPREEVFDAIKLCKSAGIRSIMITGDHKITAAAIAKELNLVGGEIKVLDGEELDKISDKELEETVRSVSVYARVSPIHKVRILEALKKDGEIVAMTGDGVNDAPALKKANIGVAMGITGTDVAKEASDVVLEDDNFATIVKAVEQGRAIYDNIRKFVLYLLSSNVGEIITIFIATLIGLPLPLIAVQILWVNLLTDGLPAVALGVDPAALDIMRRKPRDPNEKVINKQMWLNVALIGATLGIGTLMIFYRTLPEGVETARSVAFATLVMFQMFNVYNTRSERQSIFSAQTLRNRYLHLSVLVSILLLFAVIYYQPLQKAFETVAIDFAHWAYIILVSLSVVVVFETKKLLKL
ncbi:TPA: calcium-translocating P-type ATPase, SERCA-type [archaeon]|uniref:Calcium-translocating P-type ATPase, SERCA-type n=1 Tax=Candidatus Naiadarchaeum limnaeum TaxID=2756139 RepID=A0A832UR30_9ARCH|nr:calcium-translocating P-type ATPase, SERCA-type [Candidatus Naiadarchaeales archaeon SRR2090153.bin1042]HIK00107.1 calcium-translocating P-type ATPase, SERCA-type [Candidatus Naiadarchaeum limnaeum]